METVMGILILILGFCIGSFLNVCIYRIPLGKSIVYPRSYCASCSRELKPYELIPVISYVFLGGKCRGCKKKISIINPAAEIFTGILFYLIYLKFGLTIISLKFIIMAAFMIVIAGIDLSTQDVYSITTYPCIAIGFVAMMFEKFFFNYSIATYLMGCAVGAGLIWFIVFITKGMGEGDIEIAAISGLFLGIKNTLLAIMLSFIIAAVCGIFLIIIKSKTRKDFIPFGPFLFLGTIIAMLFGDGIVNLYMSSLL